jgi:hypothetical protein
MRRPLGTGIPFQLTGNGTPDIVFDMNTQPAALQDRFVFLTLFAIVPNGDTTGDVIIEQVGASTIMLQTAAVTGLLTRLASEQASPKVLDRFPVRGDSLVQVTASAAPGDQVVYMCGYIEVEGESEPSKGLRGLQASNTLVTPFTYTPVDLEEVQPSTPVHLFSNGFTDEITMFVRVSGLASPHVVVNDGVNSLDMNLAALGGDENIPIKLFDGIPMQAQAAGGSISGYTTAVIDTLVAWGYFNRR